MRKHWSDGLGILELLINEEDATYATPPGTDAAPFIADLRSQEFYAGQLDGLEADQVRDVLREYGAWDDEELADHEENLTRLLWIACGDVSDMPDDYPNILED